MLRLWYDNARREAFVQAEPDSEYLIKAGSETTR